MKTEAEEFLKTWRKENNTDDAVYSAYHIDAMEAFAESRSKGMISDFMCMCGKHVDENDLNHAMCHKCKHEITDEYILWMRSKVNETSDKKIKESIHDNHTCKDNWVSVEAIKHLIASLQVQMDKLEEYERFEWDRLKAEQSAFKSLLPSKPNQE